MFRLCIPSVDVFILYLPQKVYNIYLDTSRLDYPLLSVYSKRMQSILDIKIPRVDVIYVSV